MYYCLLFLSIDDYKEDSISVFRGAFIFHYFTWQTEHKNEWAFCEGVCIYLFQALVSSAGDV